MDMMLHSLFFPVLLGLGKLYLLDTKNLSLLVELQMKLLLLQLKQESMILLWNGWSRDALLFGASCSIFALQLISCGILTTSLQMNLYKSPRLWRVQVPEMILTHHLTTNNQ